MTELSASRFPEYFEALWDYRPFAWQSALAERVVGGDRRETPSWPQAIALPTAAGKTACIDVSIFALAAGLQRAGQAVQSRAARRIFFVVDRRIIVDEAYERAHKIARELKKARAGILREVADALRQIAYGRSAGWGDEQPLLALQLRGGMYRSEAWARSPLQPIVVASTVDQVGSRLLFRAYGRGGGMWPVFAGLVANDSLIFLDEAHCARPFMETLQAVDAYRRLARSSLSVPFHAVVLSATPPPELTDTFRDTSPEPTDPEHTLGRRQLAHKPATLLPVRGGSKRSVNALAAALAASAASLAGEDRKAIVVFVNRVATARKVHELLRLGGHDAILLTGRMRQFDKDDTVTDRLKPLSAGASAERGLAQPVFVVATQTLEVGADLDFDGLVTECASLDALRQRFGRLNRTGRPIAARAAILVGEDQAKDSSDDPIYGSALASTWAWLKAQAGQTSTVDFGIAYIEPRLPSGTELAMLCAPSDRAPVMLPAHVDALAQTSPVPEPSPEITLFLHGRGRASADVLVCWRSDIELGEAAQVDKARDLLTCCPPATAECLPVPLWRMRLWMAGETPADVSGDVEGEQGDEEVANEGPRTLRFVLRWRGRDESQVTSDPSGLRPGDVIVIPVSAGGWQALGDLMSPGDELPVLDCGDRANLAIRQRALLRLHPRLIDRWPVEKARREAFLELIKKVDQDEEIEDDPEGFVSKLKEQLRLLAQAPVPQMSWGWLPKVAESLAGDPKLLRRLSLHPFGGLILQGSRRLPQGGELADVFSDEHDATASGTVAVALDKHLPGVADFARRFAEGVGLPERLVENIELAGRLHDLGKADPRFQALLHGGARMQFGSLLAKSGTVPQGRAAFEDARRLARYPEGGRHELLSVRLAEGAEDLLPPDPVDRALVLHLVASHHGYCRPFAPAVSDAQPIDVRFELLGRVWSHSGATGLERLDSGVADRFWMLLRHYGWWSLAWMEALLRLADHRRSEWEQDHSDE